MFLKYYFEIRKINEYISDLLGNPTVRHSGKESAQRAEVCLSSKNPTRSNKKRKSLLYIQQTY